MILELEMFMNDWGGATGDKYRLLGPFHEWEHC